jgi:hypothetical protein
MGWSSLKNEGWGWSYNGEWDGNGQIIRTMLSYKNDTSTP